MLSNPSMKPCWRLPIAYLSSRCMDEYTQIRHLVRCWLKHIETLFSLRGRSQSTSKTTGSVSTLVLQTYMYEFEQVLNSPVRYTSHFFRLGKFQSMNEDMLENSNRIKRKSEVLLAKKIDRLEKDNEGTSRVHFDERRH